MLGVTIGIGPEHNHYAHEAAARFTKHTGLRAEVLWEPHLKEYGGHPIFKKADLPKAISFYLKLFLWDIFPYEDSLIYFDCDWCALRPFDPTRLAGFGVCRDRTAVIQPELPDSATVLNYFNAGLMVVNRGHRPLFNLGKQVGPHLHLKWNDQCIWNQLVIDTGFKVNYLPRIYNCLDTGPALLESNPFAIHSSANYPHYQAGTTIQTTDRLEWDLHAMEDQAGLNVVHALNRPSSIFLLPDGTDSNGNIWFISRGKHFMCDIRGYHLKEVFFRLYD